jgi:hypothetical protein
MLHEPRVIPGNRRARLPLLVATICHYWHKSEAPDGELWVRVLRHVEAGR